jgi:hypothetical protein
MHPSYPQLNSDNFDQEEDAVSTVGATSTQEPPVPELYMREDVPGRAGQSHKVWENGIIN